MSKNSPLIPGMFDNLIVSSRRPQSRRTAKFFWGTAVLYALALAAALVASVYIAAPQLADKGEREIVKLIQPPPRLGSPEPRRAASSAASPAASARRDFTNPATLEEILRRPVNLAPPSLPDVPLVGDPSNSTPEPGVPYGDVHGEREASGIPTTVRRDAPAPPPEPPPAKPATQPAASGPLRVTSTVLQGRAVHRCKPDYPALARQIRIEGAVAVELLVSREGYVESAKALNGHPLLKDAAVQAAACWRFQPTMLNGKPVPVAAVITFVFKLN